MAPRTQQYMQFPWLGGVNTSIDPGMVPQNQLTRAEDCVFTFSNSRRKRPGINFNWDTATDSSELVLGGVDFWYGNSSTRTQKEVTVHSDKTIFEYTPGSVGTRTAITFGGTAWASNISDVTFAVITNLLIIAVDGGTNNVQKWSGTGSTADLGGAPSGSIIREHLGRCWMNDKINPDRLHYSTTGNAEEWQGVGDSGALDIGVGDGDPVGITAIFPTFKGVLFVAKKTKLYRVDGQTPEEFNVTLVSNGIGCVGPNAIATVDQDTIFFCSEKGFHDLATTANFGDFQSSFVSKDIQRTFNEKFVRSRLPYVKAIYYSEINSIGFAVTDDTYGGTDVNNAIWWYNIPNQAWYVWPNCSPQSFWLVRDVDQLRTYIGTAYGRVARTFNSLNYDIDSTGTPAAVVPRWKTGIIFPDNNPYTIKGFKRFGLIYRPQGIHSINVNLTIDSFSTQSLVYNEVGSLDTLGTSFILGTSILGYGVVLAPYTQPFDGYGRGVTIEISQTGVDEIADIQGFLLEYEPAELAQETRLTT